MKTGPDLIADVDACRPAPGQGAFWWLGQHSFIAKLGQAVLYLDPYLADNASREIPPLLAPADLAHAVLVFGTHDHGDHIDRPAWPAIAAAAPACRFVLPDLLRKRVAGELGLPAERFIGLDDGKTVDVGDVRITGVAAAHEFLDQDAATGRFPYLGYVVEGNGVALYHAGDTCMYEGLQTKLSAWRLDLAFLPINGRDAERLRRNCIGNMTYQEAADLAGALRPGLAVPAHFDMFASNSEDPALFADYMAVKYPALRTWSPEYGVRRRFGAAP